MSYLIEEKFSIILTMALIQKQVKELLNELLNKKIISQNQIVIRKHLVTRASQIGDFEGFRKNSILKESNDNNRLYYCGYGRLNKSVMLTNGSSALCCNDSSIEHVAATLIENKLDKLDMLSLTLNGAEVEALGGATETLTNLRPRIRLAGWYTRDGKKISEITKKIIEKYDYRVFVGPRNNVMAIPIEMSE